MQLFLLSLLLVTAAAAPLSGRDVDKHGGTQRHGCAAYFLDNNPAGSSIISLHINNGVLSDPSRTSTDGFGAYAVNGTGFPNPVDTLMSQGSVTVVGNLLFTINAGSDTLVVFEIDPQDPWHPKMVGKPASTLGQFPISVTYSEQLKIACVLNGGAVAGVACFSVDPFSGLHAMGALRSLGSAIKETTPPSGPPGSAAEIIFNPDSSAVFALIKGNAGAIPAQPGYIVAWPVRDGRVSHKPVFTEIADIDMEFGSVFLSDSRLFLTDPSYGASILDVQGTKVTEQVHTKIAGQVVICWAAYSVELNTAYAIDAGQNLIYKLNADSGALEGSISFNPSTSATGGGGFDAAVLGKYMFLLTSTSGIAVIDLAESKQKQNFDLSSLGSRQGWDGMAVFCS